MSNIRDFAVIIIAIGVAILVGLALIRLRDGGLVSGSPDERVVFAGTTVSCPGTGKNSFKITTGTSGGICAITRDGDGLVTGGTCKDGNNTSSASCTDNQGGGSCGNTTGSGNCDQQ